MELARQDLGIRAGIGFHLFFDGDSCGFEDFPRGMGSVAGGVNSLRHLTNVPYEFIKALGLNGHKLHLTQVLQYTTSTGRCIHGLRCCTPADCTPYRIPPPCQILRRTWLSVWHIAYW